MTVNGLPESAGQENFELSLLEILITYFRQWRWYLVSLIVFMNLGFVYIKLATPQYKIETDLLIKDKKDNLGGQADLLKSLDLFTSDKIVDNEVEILKSNTIMEKVIKSLKLQTAYFTTDGVRKKELYNNEPFEVQLLQPSSDAYKVKLPTQLVNGNEAFVNGIKVPLNVPVKTEAGLILITSTGKGEFKQLLDVRFHDIVDQLQQYSSNLKIEPVSKQGTVLVITIEDAIPQRGKDFLNRLVEEYDRAAVQDKNKVASSTLSFIEDRLIVISGELGYVEKNVEQYKSKNQITDITSESQIFLQGVQDNDLELNKVIIQLSVLENLENYIKGNDQQSSSLPSMLGIDDPTLVGLVTKLAEAELKKQSLLQTIPETNPLVASINDQIKSLKQTIYASVKNFKKGLEITKQQLQLKSNQYGHDIRHVPLKERGLLDVMRQQDIKNALYTYLLQKREETAMELASGVADSRIIDYAKSSRHPVKPVAAVVLLFFLMLALSIPTVVIYLNGLLNFKITRRLDVEHFTRTPILSEISHSDEKGQLLVVSHPRSMVAEQIRVLRTNLQFIMPDENKKVILFTSSISGEGKSFVSLNLGASLAMAGKKVVILELDLRKPKLHAGLTIDNTTGLSNYLIGKVDYKDLLKKVPSSENYFIITSGAIPPNPAELLGNGKIAFLIDQLKKDFDYIILDTPPVGLVTDAQILAYYADATLFIVRHNYTAKNQISTIDNFYKNKNFKNMNIILNSVDMQMGYGYSYGYGYGYGYGGYYVDRNSKKNNIFKRLFNIRRLFNN